MEYAIPGPRYSTHGKPVLPWISVDIFTISTGPNHDYSEHTRVALSADWLHLDTFPLMGDALPQTRRLLDTWKNGCAIKASQCPGHYTGSDHDETHSEPTLVAQRADRLHLDTFSLMRDALPQTRRSMCIWLEDRCILGGLTLHLSSFTCYMSTSGSTVSPFRAILC